LVVFKDSGENQAFLDHGELHTFRDFEKKCPHRNQLSHGHAEGNVFGSSGAQSDVSLQFARPNDGAVEESKGESGSGLDTNRVLIVFVSPQSSKICVTPAVQSFGKVWLELDSMFASADEVSNNPFDGLSVGLLWTVGEASDLMDSKLDIGF